MSLAILNLPAEAYDVSLQTAKKEIMIVTSSKDLLESPEKVPYLSHCAGKGVKIRIMAPITSENLPIAQKLSDSCEVRHIPIGSLGTTIVDGAHLFQFQDYQSGKENTDESAGFKNTIYINSIEEVEKTRNTLNDIWRNAAAPSPMTLGAIIKPPNVPKNTAYETHKKIKANLHLSKKEEVKHLTEKDIINKIISAQAYPDKNTSDKIVMHYGTAGQAIIHPPAFLNLPDMLMIFSHYDKHSTYGEQDFLIVLSWEETQKGKDSHHPPLFMTIPKQQVFGKNSGKTHSIANP